MDLGLNFDSEQEQQLEVLNSIMDPANIDMKTRVNLNQIRLISRDYYCKLCDLTKEDGTPTFNYHQCKALAIKLIKRLLASKDDKNNRVLSVVEGMKSMQIMKQEADQPVSPFGGK